jgi:hypothetical protein
VNKTNTCSKRTCKSVHDLTDEAANLEADNNNNELNVQRLENTAIIETIKSVLTAKCNTYTYLPKPSRQGFGKLLLKNI